MVTRPYIVFFDVGSSAVTPQGRRIVAEFATLMKRTSDVTADLKGHTDAVEEQAARKPLSLARARRSGQP